jgi:hypothetical protein
MFNLGDPKNAAMEQALAAHFIKTWEALALLILNNMHNVKQVFKEHEFSSNDCKSFLEGSMCSLVAHLTFEIARALDIPFATATATVIEYFPLAGMVRAHMAGSEEMH